jgi:hypothetical protein
MPVRIAQIYAGKVTERKPPGVSFETWIDRQIREAQDRGEFEDLSSKGRPIAAFDEHRDELWWIRGLVQREQIETLPPTLKLRKDVDAARARIAAATSESDVRDIVAEINARIRDVNRKATSGPPSNLMPFDVDQTLEAWRQRHGRDSERDNREDENETDVGNRDRRSRRRWAWGMWRR